MEVESIASLLVSLGLGGTSNIPLSVDCISPFFSYLTQSDPFFTSSFPTQEKLFLWILILPRRRGGLRSDRRHLGEGWCSRKHETSKRETGLCFARLSQNTLRQSCPQQFFVVFQQTRPSRDVFATLGKMRPAMSPDVLTSPRRPSVF